MKLASVRVSSVACIAVILLALAAPAFAQQQTPPPGSPAATKSIDGKQLPAPEPKFGGVIKDDALSSKPWWAPRIVPPKQAPNILLIITDDSGFGVPSTFGGVIPTPTMDRVANSGLRYNNIHSTALCSPTRAALITGRNHHSAGFGVVSEQATGYPGYNSIIAEDKATIGRILLDNGYATSWFGKDHNTPAFAASQLGPFDQWPIGMGEGNAELKTAVEGFLVTDHGLRKLGSGSLDSDDSETPGAAVPLVVALATKNPLGLIVSTGVTIHGEETGSSTIHGKAKETADVIAEQLKPRFLEQGWIP